MAVKASERVQRYVNANGPTIGTVERKVISQDGLYFKDIDGTGTVSAVNDWRLSPEERAKAYVQTLTTSEKIGQLFTSDWRMGPKYPSPRLSANGHKPVGDESGLLDEAPVDVSDSIFGHQALPSTSDMVKKCFNRHVILRENPTPEDLADLLAGGQGLDIGLCALGGGQAPVVDGADGTGAVDILEVQAVLLDDLALHGADGGTVGVLITLYALGCFHCHKCFSFIFSGLAHAIGPGIVVPIIINPGPDRLEIFLDISARFRYSFREKRGNRQCAVLVYHFFVQLAQYVFYEL